MFFPQRPRVHYQRNPLQFVLCQIRFPTILRINTEIPADYQERIRSKFPSYAAKQDYGQEVSLESDSPDGQTAVLIPTTANHEFASRDGQWHVNLTPDFISFATVAYETWEDFRERASLPIQAFIDVYHPDTFVRIGLRYIDVIDRGNLGVGNEPWSELLNEKILGLLGSSVLGQATIGSTLQQAELMLEDSIGMLLSCGLRTQDHNEQTFMVDSDLFTTKVINPCTFPLAEMNELHENTNGFFRWAITDKLHEAMRPTPLDESSASDESEA